MEKKILIAKREYGNLMKDGYPIPFDGRWVVRDKDGNYLDHSAWSNDLREKWEDDETELKFVEN